MQKKVVSTLSALVLAGGMSIAGASSASAATIAAPGADCTVAQNQWAKCKKSLPGTQFRYKVKCYDGEIANRFIWRYGQWRNQGAGVASKASCAGIGSLAAQYIDYR